MVVLCDLRQVGGADGFRYGSFVREQFRQVTREFCMRTVCLRRLDNVGCRMAAHVVGD